MLHQVYLGDFRNKTIPVKDIDESFVCRWDVSPQRLLGHGRALLFHPQPLLTVTKRTSCYINPLFVQITCPRLAGAWPGRRAGQWGHLVTSTECCTLTASRPAPKVWPSVKYWHVFIITEGTFWSDLGGLPSVSGTVTTFSHRTRSLQIFCVNLDSSCHGNQRNYYRNHLNSISQTISLCLC